MVAAALNSSHIACTCKGSDNCCIYAAFTSGGKKAPSVPQSESALSIIASGAPEISLSGKGAVCDKRDQGQKSIICLSPRSHTSATGKTSNTASAFTCFG